MRFVHSQHHQTLENSFTIAVNEEGLVILPADASQRNGTAIFSP